MKKRKNIAKKRKQQKKVGIRKFLKFFSFLIVLLVLLTGVFLLTSGQSIQKIASENALQIGTFYPPTPTIKILPTQGVSPVPTTPPTSPAVCQNYENGRKIGNDSCKCPTFAVHCVNDLCVGFDQSRQGDVDWIPEYLLPPKCSDWNSPDHMWCASDRDRGHPGMGLEGDGWYCMGKPVIYLYPEKVTLVDVEVKTTGKIVVSDPHYPDGGWKHVLAEPSGKLTYEGQTYSELFYESNVKDFKKPTNGITLNSNHLDQELDTVLTKLGLVGPEIAEFKGWWIPKLLALHSPYIQFSLIDPIEKGKIDRIVYSPEPDTKIELLVYFKPINKPYAGETMLLPSTPPQRIGFTAVEWGGVIDDK